MISDAQLFRIFGQRMPETKTFMMFRSTDHITGAIGASVTVEISKAGQTLVVPQGAVREVGKGLYAIDYTASDLDTLGDLYIVAVASGCDATAECDQVVTAEEAAAHAITPGLPIAPTASSLIYEAFYRSGVPSPTELQLRRAEVQWLQEVRDEIAGAKRWHALETTVSTLSTVAGQQVYDMPDSLTRILNIWVAHDQEISPLDGPNEGIRRTNFTQGVPREWEEFERQLYLQPVPIDVYALTIRGIVDLTQLQANDVRNYRLYQEWRRALVYGLMERIAEDADDQNTVLWQQKKEQQIAKAMREDSRRRERMTGVRWRGPGGMPRWGRP